MKNQIEVTASIEVADVAGSMTEGQRVHMANHLLKHYGVVAAKANESARESYNSLIKGLDSAIDQFSQSEYTKEGVVGIELAKKLVMLWLEGEIGK